MTFRQVDVPDEQSKTRERVVVLILHKLAQVASQLAEAAGAYAVMLGHGTEAVSGAIGIVDGGALAANGVVECGTAVPCPAGQPREDPGGLRWNGRPMCCRNRRSQQVE
ncbi:hypothetical protein [Kitasatospora sp. NPDC093102]|uniref:hypothetical protein n=1 Tax=Kitasatospora sp. NPDC093102 TaxID=3155069 RepID=UPI003421B9FE